MKTTRAVPPKRAIIGRRGPETRIMQAQRALVQQVFRQGLPTRQFTRHLRGR